MEVLINLESGNIGLLSPVGITRIALWTIVEKPFFLYYILREKTLDYSYKRAYLTQPEEEEDESNLNGCSGEENAK